MLEKRSKFLITIVSLESVLSIWALFYFNYLDRLNYSESLKYKLTDLALLIQDMFTSTWWALIILTICLITIFSAVAVIYRDVKFQFISIILWFILFILALDFKDLPLNILSIVAIFIPIIIANIIGYINQNKLVKKQNRK